MWHGEYEGRKNSASTISLCRVKNRDMLFFFHYDIQVSKSVALWIEGCFSLIGQGKGQCGECMKNVFASYGYGEWHSAQCGYHLRSIHFSLVTFAFSKLTTWRRDYSLISFWYLLSSCDLSQSVLQSVTWQVSWWILSFKMVNRYYTGLR